MKKMLIIGLAIMIAAIGFIYYICSINNVKLVKLNEEIALKKNETVKLENEEVYLTLKRFVNSPAPDGATAIWSGMAVIYELEIDGQVYKVNDLGILEEQETLLYNIKVTDSDYETFAKIKIIENENVEKINMLIDFDITVSSYLNLMPTVPEDNSPKKAYFSFDLVGIDKENFMKDYEIESIKLNDIYINNAEILYEEDNGFRFYSEKYKNSNNIEIKLKNKNTDEIFYKELKVKTKTVF